MDVTARQHLFDDFDAEYYMKNKSGDLLLESKLFVSEWMFDLFSKGNITGDMLLDIGTGPDINSVLYAYPYFKKIYLSDYSRNNRKYLQEWLDGKHSGAVRHYFEYVIQLEGSTQTPGGKEEQLRNKISSILYCDVTHSNPICANTPSNLRQFDAVISSMCISSSVDTEEEYFRALQNATSLIKPGGYLVLMDVFMPSGAYPVNDIEYPCANLNIEKLKLFMETHYKTVSPLVERVYHLKSGRIMQAFNIALQIPE